MNATISLKTNAPEIWTTYNKHLRRMDQVSPISTDLKPGTVLLRLYWTNQLQSYVSIPGISLYVVTTTGGIDLIDEE